MSRENKTKLTSTEIAYVWDAYMRENMIYCFNRYFLENVDDYEIEHILEQAFTLSQKKMFDLSQILNEADVPVPQGFGDEDVDRNAPRLYSDSFLLYNTAYFSKAQINAYSKSFSECTRSDIRHFFEKCIVSATSVYNKSVNVLLSKGLYIRPNYIVAAVETNSERTKMTNRELFGRNRRLTTMELANINANLQSNAFARGLITGFAQVAQSKNVRYYLSKGREIANKHMKILTKVLQDEEILAPSGWDMESTDSVIPPFSDKLMMFSVSVICAAGYANYADSAASTMREDVQNYYTRFMAEIAMYAKEGTRIMAENQWIEQAPKPVDHRVLINV